MLTLILVVILALAFYTGARRGLVLQIIYTAGYFISFMAAKHYYKTLAPKLELYIPYPSATLDSKLVFFDHQISLDLDHAFYAAIAFCLILLIGWGITRFIGIFFNSLTYVPFINEINWLGGGIMSFLVSYVALFLILQVLALIPLDLIQNQFAKSGLARFMVEQTPILSKEIYNLWITQIIPKA